MDKKIVVSVVAFAVAFLLLILMLPDESGITPDTLPWNISHPSPGTTRVFGVTLGNTTLGEAETVFKEQAKISLFSHDGTKMAVEAFIEEINFNGLKAKIVMAVGLPPEELQGMFARGLRISSAPSGKRITLAPDDLARVRKASIASLTYMPAVHLDETVLARRFGAPAERVRETEAGVMHWLYPQHGLDVAVGSKGRPVLQYVSPGDFELLRAPLLANGELLK